MSEPLYTPCGACNGQPGRSDCSWCHGTGREITSHVEAVFRRKRYLGMAHPDSADSGWEKYVRFSAEIPPEVAAYIEAAYRKRLGVNVSAFSRANIVRAAFTMYLDEIDPRENQWELHGKTPEEVDRLRGIIDSTAVEIGELPELEAGDA